MHNEVIYNTKLPFNLPGNLLSAVAFVSTNHCSHLSRNDGIMPRLTSGWNTLANFALGESSIGCVVLVVARAK